MVTSERALDYINRGNSRSPHCVLVDNKRGNENEFDLSDTEKPETEKARASRLILLGRRPHPRNTEHAVETLLRRIRADIRANVRYTRRDVRVAINHGTIVPGDRCELVTSSPQWPRRRRRRQESSRASLHGPIHFAKRRPTHSQWA